MAQLESNSSEQEISNDNYSESNTEAITSREFTQTNPAFTLTVYKKKRLEEENFSLLKYIIFVVLITILVQWGGTIAGKTPLRHLAPSLFEEKLEVEHVRIPKKPRVELPPRPKRIKPIKIKETPPVKEVEVIPKIEEEEEKPDLEVEESQLEEGLNIERIIRDIEIASEEYDKLYQHVYYADYGVDQSAFASLNKLHRLSKVPEFGGVLKEMLSCLNDFANHEDDFSNFVILDKAQLRSYFDLDEKAWLDPIFRTVFDDSLFAYEEGEEPKPLEIRTPHQALKMLQTAIKRYPKTYANMVGRVRDLQGAVKELQEKLMDISDRWDDVMEEADALIQLYPELGPELDSMRNIGDFFKGTIVAGFVASDAADRALGIIDHVGKKFSLFTYLYLCQQAAAYKLTMSNMWNIPSEWRPKRKFMKVYIFRREQYFNNLFLFFPRVSTMVLKLSSMVANLASKI